MSPVGKGGVFQSGWSFFFSGLDFAKGVFCDKLQLIADSVVNSGKDTLN